MYFSGYSLNYDMTNNIEKSLIPKGLLMFFGMGTGKTISFIGASLKSLYYRTDIYTNASKIYIILNKSLQQKTIQEISKYIQFLNKNQLDINLNPLSKGQSLIDGDEILKRFVFITYNDPTNF